MRAKRILFVGRSTVHFSLFETVITALLARGAEVELLFNQAESRNWKGGDLSVVDDYVRSHPRLRSGWIVPRTDRWKPFVFAVRELRTYRSYLTRRETTSFYVNRARRILEHVLAASRVRLLDRPLIRRLFRTRAVDLALRAAEAVTPPDAAITRLIEARDPDAVVLTPLNMRFSEETEYLKAARRLGIPTVQHVLTWDNLSTKGLVQLMPDVVCLWNEWQKRDAMEIHGIPPSRIQVTGSPFFDFCFGQPADLMSRAAFCDARGFRPDRKVLLYLGSSQNIAADETWVVEAVRDAFDQASDPLLRECQILVRPHFANAKNYRRLSRSGVTVWPLDGALPERREDLLDMQNSFFHADATLGINSSSMIISILIGLPTFSIRLPRYAETQDDSKHFRHLLDLDAIGYAPDVAAFLRDLAAAWRGEDPKAGKRQAFAQQFARPRGLDRDAGDVVAETILAAARQP